MARRFVTPLTKPEQQALTSAYYHGEKPALRRRAHAILLSDQGHTINQTSDILQVRRDAISRWLNHWDVSGIAGPTDKPRSGQKPILDERTRATAGVGRRASSPDSVLAGSPARRDRQDEQHGTLRQALKKIAIASNSFGIH
jgi:hypothetical protein